MNKIESWKFDAFLDGQHDRAVAKINKHNPALMQPYREQQAFESALSSALYRHTCPEPDELMNFAWGMLNGQTVALVSSHLINCEHCQQEMAMLMPEPATQSSINLATLLKSLQTHARMIIGRLLPAPTLGLAPVRGEEDDIRTAVCSIDEMGWDITFTHHPLDGFSYQLNGIVLGPTEDKLAALEICLVQDDTIIENSALTTTGTFEFEGVSAGRYTLCLYSTETSICVPNILIGGYG